jgi:acyl-CoA reductase-like NAD-dependent aldehyde dehydrogenase
MSDVICISPIDGREYCRRPFATGAEIDAALEQARAAQRQWAQVPLAERSRSIRAFLAALSAMNDEIVPELAWQMGRPVRYGGELNSLRERIDYLLEIAEPSLMPEGPDRTRKVSRVPAGLVLVIAPWNYPYLTAANTIVPALLAGNAVILKHSAQTPLAGEHFARAFAQAGLPNGLFTNLFISHENVARLLGSNLIDHATFTGSVEGGRDIQHAAAKAFTPLTLELGGKDPAYVRADADIAHAVVNLVDGAFYNSGQSCCGIERIYVDRSVWNPFLDGFVETTRRYRLGNPLDPSTTLGPMAALRFADLVRDQVAEALSKGARPCIDPSESGLGAAYLTPQVLIDVDHSMRIMCDESFGPVVGIMPVDSDEQAVTLMNDSRYGLTASVWTRDTAAAERLAPTIEAGTVFMNRCDYIDPALAWTGVKHSGRGASLGRYGFEAVTRPRSYHFREL